jgi:hypothetical protein
MIAREQGARASDFPGRSSNKRIPTLLGCSFRLRALCRGVVRMIQFRFVVMDEEESFNE